MTPTSEPLKIVSFPIEGMTCASCVSRITRSLRRSKGVKAVKVNLATESATVRFDPTLTDVAGLAHAVESAGYVARIDQLEASAQAPEAPADRHLAALRRLTALAAWSRLGHSFRGPKP